MPRTRSEVALMPAARRGMRSPVRKWSASQARQVLEAWRTSGLTLSAYARRLGVGRERLAWWRRRLKMESPRRAPRNRRFVPLIVRPAGPELLHTSDLSVEVVLGSGRLIRVAVGRDFNSLSRLIEALETTRC